MSLDLEIVSLTVSDMPEGWLSLRPFGYTEAFRDAMRGIPGATWHSGQRAYLLPGEAWPCMEQLIRAQIAQITSDQRKPGKRFLPAAEWLPKHTIDGLRDYQIEGARFIYRNVQRYGATLLGDDPGLGKTVQLIYAARALEADNLLIIAPAVVCCHWAAELAKWWPTMCCKVIDSRKQISALAEIASDKKLPIDDREWHNMSFILSYDFFRSNEKALLDVLPVTSGIVLDEIHYVQNSSSKRGKAIHSLCNRDRQATWIVGLSGTPMTSRPRDLWHPLECLFPRRFGRFIPFAVRYCDGHQEQVAREKLVWKTDGASNTKELAGRLSSLMIRRSRLDVLKDLPERNRIVIPVEPPISKRKKLAEIAIAKGDPASMRKALQLIEKYKVDAAIELSRDLVENGSKVLVYTMTRAHAAEIAEALDVAAVTGEDSPKDRRRLLEHSCAKASIGVATVYSVTTGIDLTVFDSVIFVGLDWVPANLLQAEARAHRLGQKSNVNIYYLVAMGTIDEAIREKVIWRLDTFGEILGGAAEQQQMRKDLRQYDEEQLLDQIVQLVMKGDAE